MVELLFLISTDYFLATRGVLHPEKLGSKWNEAGYLLLYRDLLPEWGRVWKSVGGQKVLMLINIKRNKFLQIVQRTAAQMNSLLC